MLQARVAVALLAGLIAVALIFVLWRG